jgi:N-acetyl-1-D-myo-inositol-2-amino-2-deoxy-alpha-D-glucopyranoside deacetylase/mycothiol S-conjugate amidase
MRGSEQNKLPDALATASVETIAGRMAKIIRELKPDVVVTHDAGGDYGHPDHIATHKATGEALYAAGDPAQYPEAGAVFRPSKLYFGVRPRQFMKLLVKLMPMFGQNPHHFGRNKDIDITKTTDVDYPFMQVYVRPNRPVRFVSEPQLVMPARVAAAPQRTAVF